jgi:hypothetical protein
VPKKPPQKKSPTLAPRPKTSTAGAQPDEPDDAIELVDEALLSFVLTPALGSTNLLVIALSPTGDLVIQDRQLAEARRIPEALAISISTGCERYAATERRATRFRAAWMRGHKTLATYAWECGESAPQAAELNGSVQSFLQQQQLFAQAQHKLHLEGFEMVQEGWAKLLLLGHKRIEALERDNAELRDRMRKLDDVGSEIAIEQMRAEVEQRGRTADLIEKRLLPLAQSFALSKIESAARSVGGGGQSPLGNSKPEHSEEKKPSA